MSQYQGSCHCGQVQYQLDADPLQTVSCHCNLCRAMSGAPFSSYVVVPEANFALKRGAGRLAAYQATERSTKHFCSTCGTPVFNSNPTAYPGLVILYLGTLAQHADFQPKVNLFCDSQLPWVQNNAAAINFDRGPQRE